MKRNRTAGVFERSLLAATSVLGAAVLGAPATARAHHAVGGEAPHTFADGLLSGLGHPVIGLVHAAFIVAVGWLAAKMTRGVWAPLAFVGGTLCGAGLVVVDVRGFAMEWGASASVVLVGLMIARSRPRSLPTMASVFALAGLFHGWAYGAPIVGAEPTPLGAYLLGFTLVQMAMAYAVWLTHRWLLRSHAAVAPALAAAVGAIVTCVGVASLLQGMAT